MHVYDLSPTIANSTAVFPGDVGFQRNVSMSFEAGHHLTLSSVQTTLHIGSHADGSNHYLANSPGIDRRDPSLYVGAAQVVRVQVKRGERVGLEHLPETLRETLLNSIRLPKRVLIRTGTFPNPQDWNSDFASLDPELIKIFFRSGVRLIGIDTPSIDPESSKMLESHQVVAQLGMAILEGLCLDGVPEGIFTLVAAPLKIKDGDAGPLRALLFDGRLVDASSQEPLAFTWVECETALQTEVKSRS
jgi:arylformamidase